MTEIRGSLNVIRGRTRIILEQVVPFAFVLWANKRIEQRVRTLDDENLDEYSRLDLEELKECHVKELARRDKVDLKAKVGVIGVTLALTFISGGVQFLGRGAPGRMQVIPCTRPAGGGLGTESSLTSSGWESLSKKTQSIALMVGALYLLMGGLLAFRAISVVPTRDLWLDSRLDLADGAPDEIKAYFARSTKYNQYHTMKMTNQTAASFLCIRNGAISICVFIVFATLSVLV